jgi:hypothetical protein
MPSSSVRSFTDPDEYAAAIRQGTHELTVTQRGTFAAKLARVDLHRLWMQRFSENLPRISHVDGWGGRSIIAFRTQTGPSVTRNGVELRPTSISRLPPGASYYYRSAGAASFASVSLPLEEMASVGLAVVGRDLSRPVDALTVTPSPTAMGQLQRLHAAAAALAEHAPAVIAHPEAARGLEQALIGAMVACLDCGDRREDTSASRQHALIMRKFHRAIAEKTDHALFIPELCAAIGVSERTLRVCCQEHLGRTRSATCCCAGCAWCDVLCWKVPRRRPA